MSPTIRGSRPLRLLAPLCALLIILSAAPPVWAAGTVTRTGTTTDDGATVLHTFTWTANASGAVSGDTTTIALSRGQIARLEIVPNGGGTQPSDNYDVELVTTTGIDVLGGLGANLSNATGLLVVHSDLPVMAGEVLELRVTNAGNAKGGTLRIYIRR